MKRDEYREIIRVIDGCEFDFDEVLDKLIKDFPNVPAETLLSIVCLDFQRRIKKYFYKYNSDVTKNSLHQKFVQGLKSEEPRGIIVQLSKIHKFTPTQVGRAVLENSLSAECSKNEINMFLKYTNLIKDRKLAYEIFLANIKDSVHGIFAESVKHSIGLEYELLIKENLKKLDIAFQDENDLRDRGYDKTPDVKLEVPIAVNGMVINWIESKALFGDEKNHKTYMNDQFWSYWNRFGPGLVIYWFGFIEELDQKTFLILDSFPQNITKFEP